MTPEQAIKIVAMQLVANAARGIQWEDIPEVGEDDYAWLAEVILELAPETLLFDEALTFLEGRASHE